MAPPINIDWTTAINISSLPYLAAQDVTDYETGINHTVWYKYTAQAADLLVGMWGYGYFTYGQYRPELRVYTVPIATPVPYLSISAVEKPVQFPVVVGTTYYFEFSPTGADVIPAFLSIEGERTVNLPLLRGSILVNDDTQGFPLIVLSSADGDNYNVRSAIDFVPAGEAGDVLPSGVSLWSDAWNSNLQMYDASFNLITTIASDIGFTISIRGNRGNNLFYVARFAGSWHWTVTAYDETGAVVDTWDLLLTGQGLDGLAASNDGTILYFSQMDALTPIRRWDLVNNIALSDLAATAAGGNTDILVLDDDSIVVANFNYGTGNFTVRRYDPSGTLLNTYNFGDVDFPAGTPPRLAYAADFSPRSFWVWFHLTIGDSQISRFQHVLVSDGSILASVDSAEYEGGIYEGTATPNPDARFGNSFSCPFVVFTQGETTGTIVVIKVTNPTGSPQVFDFTAGGGLSPSTFQLSDGESQQYDDVTPGSGYSITETPVNNWNTTYDVSNGSPINNISVAAGETVTVTVTNVFPQVGGIYILVPGKRDDTLWTDFDPPTEVDVKIPNPFARTALLGE